MTTQHEVCEFVVAQCEVVGGAINRDAVVKHFDVTKNHASVLLHRLYRRGRLARPNCGQYMPAFGPLAIPTGPQDIPIPSFLRRT